MVLLARLVLGAGSQVGGSPDSISKLVSGSCRTAPAALRMEYKVEMDRVANAKIGVSRKQARGQDKAESQTRIDCWALGNKRRPAAFDQTKKKGVVD